MSYHSWFEDQAQKHAKVVQKLLAQNRTEEEIIAYFDFHNMVKNEPDFCPLYREKNAEGKIGKKCHDIQPLNCYLCACPNFRFKDDGFNQKEGKTVYSYCDIDSKDGRQGIYGDAVHQDCSGCSVPHHVSYIKKHFDTDWKKVMKDCER